MSGPKLPWIDRYNALVAWMSAHGGAWPRQRGRQGRLSSMSEADAEEHRLALWVHHQRGRGQTLLSQEVDANGMSQADLLERLEGWAWRGQEHESWMSRYEGLVAWMSAHGGAWPRKRHRLGRISSMSGGDAEEYRHAQWVQTQRKRGQTLLSQEVEANGMSRADLLERLEGWAWRQVEFEPWLSRYDGLVAWMSAHGGAWPRVKGRGGRLSDKEEHRLAKWVNDQRRSRSLLEKVEAREGMSRRQLLQRLGGWAWRPVNTTEEEEESFFNNMYGLDEPLPVDDDLLSQWR